MGLRSNEYKFAGVRSESVEKSGKGRITYDPTGRVARGRMERIVSPKIMEGTVLRSGCKSYDCVVKLGKFEVPCNMLTRQVAQGFGTMTGDLPVEGTNVLVIMEDGTYSSGIILGCIPWHTELVPNDNDEFNAPVFSPNDKIDPYYDNYAYHVPFEKENMSRMWSNSLRPADVIPGESVVYNENHVGMLNSMFSVELTGGASFIRVSRLDDSVKVRSTNYTKWTANEAVDEFNDGGYISAEGRNYSYQGELLGDDGLSGSKRETPSDVEGKEPRPRARFWRGFLGNVLSLFAVRAKKNKDESDTGLASIHVSQGGNVMVRGGGGVSIERYDRIPVPNRVKRPWDPEGDDEQKAEHKGILPFNVENPHDRALAQASFQAWAQKSMYQRFDELKKDFSVENEGDVKTPSDEDDDPSESKEIKYSENEGRHAGVYVGDDGSVIIRDAWGSEIVMLGGNIFLNTPGNVITTANKDIVSIARGSAVIRGTNAAELSSEEKNVRIHGNTLVEIAGGTDKNAGGVLIEALGEGNSVSADKEAGDEAKLNGVLIKSEKAAVSVGGSNTYINAGNNVFVTSGKDGDKRDGNIYIDGKYVAATGIDGVMLSTEKSMCSIRDSAAVLASDNSTLVAGNKSATIISNKSIPVMWFPIDSDLRDLYRQAKETVEDLQPSDLVAPYTWDTIREHALFSFRKSDQAGTSSGIEPWKKNSGFTMYEPWWQIMVSSSDPMASGEPYSPKVEKVNGTACWPYMPSIESGRFKKVDSPANVEKGYSKNRDSLSDTENITDVSMSEFKV